MGVIFEMHRFVVTVSAVSLMAGLSGCGGGPSDAPELASVSGVVMLDGKPAGGLTVELHPDNNKGTSGPMSSGVTSDSGAFTVSASGGRAGAVVGWHKVLIKCPWRLEDNRGNTEVTADGFGSSAEGNTAVGSTEDGGNDCSVAQKFEDSSSTPLTAEVPADGVNDLLFQVTSK